MRSFRLSRGLRGIRSLVPAGPAPGDGRGRTTRKSGSNLAWYAHRVRSEPL